MTRNNSIFEQTKRYTEQHLESLVKMLLPNGMRAGNEYKALNPTRQDSKIGSFSVNLNSGKWADFATGDSGGDAISLCAYIKKMNQYAAAKELLSNKFSLIANGNLPNSASKAPKPSKVDNSYFLKIWNGCQEPNGTVVEKYLESRGIIMALPPTIRYHHGLFHTPSKSYHPAMVAAITVWPSNKIIALHRTYLKSDGSGKADVEPNKMLLGSAKGGAVRLAPLSNKLIITEGIETALSIQQATGIPTWAALSASFMQHIILPPPEQVPEIIVAADNDAAGLKAAHALCARLHKEGYVTKLIVPTQPGADFNDLSIEEIKSYVAN